MSTTTEAKEAIRVALRTGVLSPTDVAEVCTGFYLAKAAMTNDKYAIRQFTAQATAFDRVRDEVRAATKLGVK